MLISDLVEYFATVMNVNVKNELVFADMAEELERIAEVGSLNEFKQFAKENINSMDVSYMSGFQKFFKLCELFRKKQFAKVRERIPGKSKSLKDKIISAFGVKNMDYLLDDRFSFESVKLNGEKYFTEKELYILSSIGAKNIYIGITDTGYLEMVIRDEYDKQAKKLESKVAIENKSESKKVSTLVASAIKNASMK